MTISHAALGFVVLGAVATAAWNLELIRTMKPGDTAEFAGFGVTLDRSCRSRAPTTSPSARRITLTRTAGPTPR
jgi:cytochrome c-type biogenesis protein CcmF